MRRTSFWIAILNLATPVLAAPQQWTGPGANAHYYEYISAPEISWQTANAAAQTHSFNGVQGTLATITSAGENAFLASSFPERGGSDQNAWLGAFQNTSAPDYSEPAGGWRWVTGEAWSYTNWFTSGPVEPDDFGGAQNYLRSNVNWQWDDIEEQPANPSIQTISGYIVEYVPEPAMLPFVLLGALLCGAPRRGTSPTIQSAS